ncbi:hypothetical protein BKA70DRAFT_1497334 [Coprinopsis sp. MPI-PUGE-AT-0042]|nr:hypothetical protein BKA70DRAFT_1497334 [Coprinopsis sp. MPI-PUGE-AT-0042]
MASRPRSQSQSSDSDSDSTSPSSRCPSPSPRYGTEDTIHRSQKRKRPRGLQSAPRKKPAKASAFRRHGRHFGRTVFAFTNLQPLILSGMSMDAGTHKRPDSARRAGRVRKEYRVYRQLLNIIPGLEDLLKTPGTDIEFICTEIQAGVNSARSDDTKGLKPVIIDWITEGKSVNPPLRRNAKAGRGFEHDITGRLLCPVGVDWDDARQREQLRNHEMVVSGTQWPHCMYEHETCDPCDPWKGLLRNQLLVKAFKHIFMSPSSVDGDRTATRAGNARLHNMNSVTKASIAYVATQTFSRTDEEMDSETFYNSIIEFLEDPEEQKEADSLVEWWNKFSPFSPAFSKDVQRVVPERSALALLRQRREQMKKNAEQAADMARAQAASGA